MIKQKTPPTIPAVDLCTDCFYYAYDKKEHLRECEHQACLSPVDGSPMACVDARDKSGPCDRDGLFFLPKGQGAEDS